MKTVKGRGGIYLCERFKMPVVGWEGEGAAACTDFRLCLSRVSAGIRRVLIPNLLCCALIIKISDVAAQWG